MRHAIDTALLSLIGYVNKAVFTVSGGRVRVYRFHGRPVVLLDVTGPTAPVGEIVMVSYLPDGDDYVVVEAEGENRIAAALRTATAATLFDEQTPPGQQIPVDISMLTDATERTALLGRLLKGASLSLRHEVRKRREGPIARLTPHSKPTPRDSVARVEFPEDVHPPAPPTPTG
ncbi:hypothetical protein AB0I81_58220 [Nonomuraea sp. NPDC050404]|uniref:hypothetical protein n=1 Tax=Nonomuraea sp. NPDC050404 TaxID=3155783 RepID=UPI0033EA6E4A